MPVSSTLLLAVTMRITDGQPVITFNSGDRSPWSRRPEEPPPDHRRTEPLWQSLRGDWTNRRNILLRVGKELADWLLDEEARKILLEGQHPNEDAPRWRIEWYLDEKFSQWPWEIVALDGPGHLGVHPSFTCVRSHEGEPEHPPLPTSLVVQLQGVQLKKERAGSWAVLDTGKELDRIYNQIKNSRHDGRFRVEMDALGQWGTVCNKMERDGPPHIFHFAGHGVEQGDGLLFLDDRDGPDPIETTRIAQLLANPRRGRRLHLVFLNACRSAGTGTPTLQPFGGLTRQLLNKGIPMVVGLLAPVEDNEAAALATEFYGAIGEGDSVDVALQKAREQVYMTGSQAGWAFLTLSLLGPPLPLMATPPRSTSTPGATILDFGFDQQAKALKYFLLLEKPLVIVVRGQEGTGHEHFLKQVPHLLESKRTLWKPLVGFEFRMAGDASLHRHELAGTLAQALEIADDGEQNVLEARLARGIAERCETGKVLVFQINATILLEQDRQAEALLVLVQHLWIAIMTQAMRLRTRLPVYLIVPIATPKQEVPIFDWKKLLTWRKKNEQLRLHFQASEKRMNNLIQRLNTQTSPEHDVRVEILPALEPFTHDEVAQFLDKALAMAGSEHDEALENIMGINHDNTRILSLLKQKIDNRNAR
ncbi:MAG: CHAT domain-containing protein [Magnetococcales bacterium]|nr:CHAT domain-containing protein [Magnetococcales bacterium]